LTAGTHSDRCRCPSTPRGPRADLIRAWGPARCPRRVPRPCRSRRTGGPPPQTSSGRPRGADPGAAQRAEERSRPVAGDGEAVREEHAADCRLLAACEAGLLRARGRDRLAAATDRAPSPPREGSRSVLRGHVARSCPACRPVGRRFDHRPGHMSGQGRPASPTLQRRSAAGSKARNRPGCAAVYPGRSGAGTQAVVRWLPPQPPRVGTQPR
jgi:hypothetical protein